MYFIYIFISLLGYTNKNNNMAIIQDQPHLNGSRNLKEIQTGIFTWKTTFSFLKRLKWKLNRQRKILNRCMIYFFCQNRQLIKY